MDLDHSQVTESEFESSLPESFVDGNIVRRATAAAQSLRLTSKEDEQWREKLASRVKAHRAKRFGEDFEDNDPSSAPAGLTLDVEDWAGPYVATRSDLADEGGFENAAENPQEAAVSVNESGAEDFVSGFGGPGGAITAQHSDRLNFENTVSRERGLAEADLAEAKSAETEIAGHVPEQPPAGPYRRIITRAASADESGKLIAFPSPRLAEQPPQRYIEELAEPILASPRILDVPEYNEGPTPSPEIPGAEGAALSFEDLPLFRPVAAVHLDDGRHELDWPEPVTTGFELPLQAAPFAARATAASLDAALVLGATAIFAAIVLTVGKVVVHGKPALVLGMLVPAILWAAYHYLFLVYAGSTPGMQMARLELTRFDGQTPARNLRAARAMSLLVSCMSFGMGFAWACIDEDRLGWHDRITHTYLRES